MRVVRTLIAACAVALASGTVFAVEMNCHGPSNVEDFHYTWHMRGGLAWIAGLIFPTSGVGELKTVFPAGDQHSITSELLITSPDQRGYYVYQSEMDGAGQKTLVTYHGYAWKDKWRKERTVFDYVKRLAQIHREKPAKQWDSTEPLPGESFRDVLTAIYYLRQDAPNIHAPMVTTIYSDGHSYPVIFRPIDSRTFEIQGQKVNALGFEIVDAGTSRKHWPGGVKVWVSNDERRIPFRIEILQSMASLQLELQSVESCAFMAATNEAK